MGKSLNIIYSMQFNIHMQINMYQTENGTVT